MTGAAADVIAERSRPRVVLTWHNGRTLAIPGARLQYRLPLIEGKSMQIQVLGEDPLGVTAWVDWNAPTDGDRSSARVMARALDYLADQFLVGVLGLKAHVENGINHVDLGCFLDAEWQV